LTGNHQGAAATYKIMPNFIYTGNIELIVTMLINLWPSNYPGADTRGGYIPL
jgi:hypothetical protein